ncbi:uncharacterized protein SPPG_07913 [Spizellomyces punctatus DAOM BR117]|uniref:Uncharacterized protein n=1 Tax=Spizellomyces punctatus (strain DAOM BR117) TaxID=645134 RepID=A0A0L0H666_SPIPD|nr:uncharacterized protein SPPG_07913 [Spizellomyces punctatus DAOM BR117]KNC96702.1 hypothetical protein SPPG_07913 [Spizellomyces punctatus DAOM BR117]|eukprot:XP_016604742.1 hypothetical protein SPPG_07913 [Spizellomyces punctatus DAOM BR117]
MGAAASTNGSTVSTGLVIGQRLCIGGKKDDKAAIQSAKAWKMAWMEYVQATEDSAASTVLWVQYESPSQSSALRKSFTNIAHLTSEVPIFSRTLVASLDAHIAFLITLSRSDAYVREQMKCEQGIRLLHAVIISARGMWQRLCNVFREAMGNCQVEVERMDGMLGEIDEGAVKGKIVSLKKGLKSVQKAANGWEKMCREQENHCRLLREWWRKDWMAHLKYDETPPTPRYLQLLDMLHSQLVLPATTLSLRTFSTSFGTVLQTLRQLLDREEGSLLYVRKVKVAEKKAVSAERTAKAQSQRQAKIAPEPSLVETDAQVLLNVPVQKQRKLLRKVHLLNVARHRLHVNAKDNAEFARERFWKVEAEFWACAYTVASALESVYYATMKKEGLDLPVSQRHEHLADPIPPAGPPLALADRPRPVGTKRASRWKLPATDNQETADVDSVVILSPIESRTSGSSTSAAGIKCESKTLAAEIRSEARRASEQAVDSSAPAKAFAPQSDILSGHQKLYPCVQEDPLLASTFQPLPSQSTNLLPELKVAAPSPTAPPAAHFDPKSNLHSRSSVKATRGPPPPPPFAPGHVPDAAEMVTMSAFAEACMSPLAVTAAPHPPPIPPRPAHQRRRLLRHVDDKLLWKPDEHALEQRPCPPPVPQKKKPKRKNLDGLDIRRTGISAGCHNEICI